MRKLLLAIGIMACGLCGGGQIAAAEVVNIPTVPQEGAIPLFSGAKVGTTGDEIWTRIGPMTVIRNITQPTITPILPPPGKATGAAVILAPGGGMVFLALPPDEIARTLTARGIAVFLLKYRVVKTPPAVADLMVVFHDLQEKSKTGEVVLPDPGGDADAQAAVALVRSNAARWGIDKARVGLLGFSSGARVSRAAALSDRPEGRPDFVGLIYGAMDAVPVPATAPPMFAAIAMDDTTVTNEGFPIVESWRQAKRPVELHAYQTGGHGFAQGGPNATHRLFLEEFMAWMTMQGFIPAPTMQGAK